MKSKRRKLEQDCRCCETRYCSEEIYTPTAPSSSWLIIFILSTLLLVGGLYISFKLQLQVCNSEVGKLRQEVLSLGQSSRLLKGKLHGVLQEKLNIVEETISFVKEQEGGNNSPERLREMVSDLKMQL